MKNLISVAVIVAFISALLIGCGFVDDNTALYEEEPAQVEAMYGGYFATQLDTMGYEDP